MTNAALDKMKLYSVEELANQCGVSQKTIRRWIASRELPAYRLGRQWRIRAADIEMFLKVRRSL